MRIEDTPHEVVRPDGRTLHAVLQKLMADSARGSYLTWLELRNVITGRADGVQQFKGSLPRRWMFTAGEEFEQSIYKRHVRVG